MAVRATRSLDAEAILAKVGKGRSIVRYGKDQIVFSQGDAADAVFYIQKGKIKITVVSPQGKEAVTAILGTDDFFGEGCLTGQPRRMATVAVMANSAIMRIEKATIIRLIHDDPGFSEIFMAHILARTIRVEEDLVDQLFNSSEKRLARQLSASGELRQGRKTRAEDRQDRQETLADMIGTTRARVSFFMNKFRKLGYIKYNGSIEVHTSLLNAILHDLPADPRYTPQTLRPARLASCCR